MQKAKMKHSGVNEKYTNILYEVVLKKKKTNHLKTLGLFVAADNLDETLVSSHPWEPYY